MNRTLRTPPAQTRRTTTTDVKAVQLKAENYLRKYGFYVNNWRLAAKKAR